MRVPSTLLLRIVRLWLEAVESPSVRQKLLELEEVLHREVSATEARRYRRLWWFLEGNKWA